MGDSTRMIDERIKSKKREKMVFDENYQTLKTLYTKLKDRYKLTAIDLMSKLDEKEILIPSCVFNKKLSTFETIVKYLKENLALSNKEIALLTSKSQKSIWQSYNLARKKLPAVFKVVPSDYYIPISILKKPLTILESVTIYLKDEFMLNFHEIGITLKRDNRTVWTVYQRAKER